LAEFRWLPVSYRAISVWDVIAAHHSGDDGHRIGLQLAATTAARPA